jgi:hypothetical protein
MCTTSTWWVSFYGQEEKFPFHAKLNAAGGNMYAVM